MTGWRALTNPTIARNARGLASASERSAHEPEIPSCSRKGLRKFPDELIAEVKRDCASEPQIVVAARYGLSATYVRRVMDGVIRLHVKPATKEG